MHNYLVVGAGGTGSHLLKPLHTYLGAYHKLHDDWMLYVIDGDIVEEKNLDRQSFRPGHVSMNKAEAAALSLGDKDHVKAIPEYLGEDNMEKYVREFDTVLICVDNMTVRKRIEERALQLADVVVVNGGNEETDGSVQLWVRSEDQNLTPRLSYGHPEVAIQMGADRAEMTCAQAAALPGGEQTIIANLQSATWMLTALWRAHQESFVAKSTGPAADTWTELQFDALNGTVEHIDARMSSHWNT